MIAILVYSLRHPVDNWEVTAWPDVGAGGAAGNLYDRINYGYVIDFLDVFYGTYHWPTFNVADSSITIGIGFLLLEVLHKALGGGSKDRCGWSVTVPGRRWKSIGNLNSARLADSVLPGRAGETSSSN